MVRFAAPGRGLFGLGRQTVQAVNGVTLTVRQGEALGVLMELPDNDLLDLLLRRAEPDGAINTSDVRGVLEMLRT